MKNIKKIIMLLFVGCFALAVVSCEKESKDLTSVTEWPELTVLGETFVIVSPGQQVTPPNAIARFGRTGATTPVGITGYINTQAPGFYQLNFTARDIKDKFTRVYDESFSALVVSEPLTENFAGTYRVSTTAFATNFNYAAIQNALASGSVTFRANRTVTQMVPGALGWYRFADMNQQSGPVALEILDMGGGNFSYVPVSSGWGTTEAYSIEYNPATQTFTIICMWTTGNTGYTWGVIYEKI
jgi:hypothetical protein